MHAESINNSPLVSTVIPTRNRPELVLRAVRSVLNQTYQNLEVIVVIDGPDPETFSVLGNINDNRICVVQLSVNVGVSAARNAGVLRAHGTWIAFLDDDDEWLPRKIERQLELAKSTKSDLVLICCRRLTRGRRSGEMRDCESVQPTSFPRPDRDWSEYFFCGGNTLLPSTYLISRLLFEKMQFAVEERHNEDVAWLLRLKKSTHFTFLATDEVLAIYRNENASGRLSTQQTWEEMLEWATSNRTLLTSRAYAYYVVRTCVGRARLQRESFQTYWLLFKEAFFRGHGDLRCIALFFRLMLLPSDLRGKLASCYRK